MSRVPITIIIPIYVARDEQLLWLDECIDSALKTTARVVVWDDGSTLPINFVLDKYKKYLSGWGGSAENRGPAYGRNRAIELANTPLVFPLDCDDTVRDDAMIVLHREWARTQPMPLYCDVQKFGEDNVLHYQLLDWTPTLQCEKLGIASVNVLHTVEQWKAVGGYDESFTRHDLYEDAEYNARLFWTYGTRCIHAPLVNYRQHFTSRVRNNKAQAYASARAMLDRIKEYDMACCGKKRKSASNVPSGGQDQMQVNVAKEMAIADLPGTQGDRILVEYTGRNTAKHYYRGPVTKFPYKVVAGQLLYVDRQDTRGKGDMPGTSLFLRVKDE